jgi:chromosomal replication initiator protein
MTEIWDGVANKIRSKISDINYNAWFGQVQCQHIDDHDLLLEVPNSFTKEWLDDYYSETIRDELQKVTGRSYTVRFSIQELQASQVPRESIISNPDAPAPRPLVTGIVRAPIGEPINARYSFDRFVTGSNNQFASAACKAVADLPGGHYNPLFIYGGVGLGKTHLLNAIGLSLQRTHPDLRILYVRSERFVNEVISGIRFDKMPELRRRYRESCDILLMDDIQFIAGKERTQEEFFHTFNCLYEAQKQIVVTSDKFPKDITHLEERLRSRFEWGLIADIQAPDLETRVAILQKKAEADNIHLADDVSLYLAQQIQSNVRELEGALIRLSAYSSLNGIAISVELARETLKDLIKEDRRRCSIENVQKLVADYYQIKIPEIKSARRMKHLAFPRQIAMYLCKKHVKSSYPEIGQKFGGKDHTTVIHACRKIAAQMKTDARLRDDIEFLEKSLHV